MPSAHLRARAGGKDDSEDDDGDVALYKIGHVPIEGGRIYAFVDIHGIVMTDKLSLVSRLDRTIRPGMMRDWHPFVP